MTTTATDLVAALRKAGDPKIASHSQRFFKTGKGEYGEGDVFLGIRVPALRALAASSSSSVTPREVAKLIRSKFHEARLLAVIIWTLQYKKGDETRRRQVFDMYLRNTKHINNWDIVDASAHKIVGPRLHTSREAVQTVKRLARSSDLWERRIAMMSTYHEIKNDRFDLSLVLAKRLLHDEHDLIHRIVGWMLREIGKRDLRVERAFLDEHVQDMPRTMLRYAIEKFSKKDRRHYLHI